MMPPRDPVAPADDDARALARDLLALPHAALSYLDAETAAPAVSRIAFGRIAGDGLYTFVSALAPHSAGLRAHPACALLLGEPGSKGDPLTHPRLMIRARAVVVEPDAPQRPALRDAWLRQHPKAKLYIDFADFSFVKLVPVSALLNGGFARAYRIDPDDLLT